MKVIGKYFLTDEEMNEFYLDLCDQYNEVKWGRVIFGERKTFAEWYVK